jgi:hypothetical protein
MKYLFTLILGFILFSCNSDNPTNPQNTVQSNYIKINTIQSGNIKFEMYSATGSTLFNGYNDIGFKFFIGSEEMKSGFVTFRPMMYHFPGDQGHSSPVSDSYTYDAGNNIFKGYANLIVFSDSSGIWAGYYSYNDSIHIDSIPFYIGVLSSNLMTSWSNVNQQSYTLTLINPQNPGLGINTFSVMLHKTTDFIRFSEVNNAEMVIYPWMVYMGHSSSHNENPVLISNGKYQGKVNLTMSGLWDVYDTIRVNGALITNIPPPKFGLTVQ